MKRTLLAAALLCATATASADENLGAHVGASAAVAAALTIAFKDTKEPVLYAIAATMALGVAKELYDSGPGDGQFSGEDLAADLLGATMGAGVTGIIITPRFIGYRGTW